MARHFVLLAVIGVLLFTAVAGLPETLAPEQRTTTGWSRVAGQYGTLLRNGRYMRYMRYVGCVTLYYVAAYAFITGSPFVYISYFGVPEAHYGWLFGVNIVGLMAVSLLNRELVTRFSLDALLRAASLMAAVGGLALAALAYARMGGIYGIAVPVFVLFSANGVIAASATAAALDTVPSDMVGSASALLGALQYGSGIVSSILLALCGDGTPWTMAWVMAVFVVACAVTAWQGRGAWTASRS